MRVSLISTPRRYIKPFKKTITRCWNRSNKIRYYSTPTTAKVARFHQFGQNPQRFMKIVDENLPSLKSNDVLVEMLFAPINPLDFNIISGNYPVGIKLPGIGGSEGVGKVIAVGNGVKSLKINDLVFPNSVTFGTWRTYAVCGEKDVLALPPTENVKPEYLASLSINPSAAFRLLNDFVTLKEGDVIVLNGANSMVGFCITQIAHSRGIKTINIYRKTRADFHTLTERMKKYGAYLACNDEYIRTPEFKSLISDLPKPKLALNCVGGESVTEMARLLEKGGTLVTYGGMSNKPVTTSTSSFIFNDIILKGFSLQNWISTHSVKERIDMYKVLINLMKQEKLRLWHERHPFNDKFGFALQRSQDYPNRDRKVLLSFS